MQLNAAQIDDVLSRNSDLRLRVLEFNVLLSVFTWSQLIEKGFFTWTFDVPGFIPSDGVYVVDSVFGNVVVFPDANGVLRFNATANVGSAHLIGPSGLPNLPTLPSLTTVTVLLALVAVGFILFEVMPVLGPIATSEYARHRA